MLRKFFQERTQKHIDRVKKYCKRIHKYNPERFEGIIERGEEHDQSKYADPEIEPYILITWEYHCKDTGKWCNISRGAKDRMNEATTRHVKNNRHHPEYHDGSSDEKEMINREDRDAIPDKMIDATAMTDLDIAEMIADWCAMSEERGNTPFEWAKKNVNKRWQFTSDQKYLIYKILHEIWV